MGACFITGTDTGVGKTHVTVLCLRVLRAAGRRVAAFKPIACGDRADAAALQEASSPGLSLDEVNPLCFDLPVAPLVAARAENRLIDWPLLRESFERLTARHEQVLVEGVGGLLAPISLGQTLADLAVELAWPTVVVVPNRLGCLNHAILTVEAIRSRGLTCLGLILNQPTPETDATAESNGSVLAEWLGLPILAQLPFGAREISTEWLFSPTQDS